MHAGDGDGEYSDGKKRPKYEKKRPKCDFIDDIADEDEDEYEEDEYEEEDDGGARRKRKKIGGCEFIDAMAQVDDHYDEEEQLGDQDIDFIEHDAVDVADEDERRIHRQPLLSREEQEEDIEEFERRIQERYARSRETEYGEEPKDVWQQALLPSIRDPKLWMVKCAIGCEREVVACLMQKVIDKDELRIQSAVSLDHLKNYIYIEADKEAHVREAIKGIRKIFPNKITLVPIKEMTDVLSVESKVIDLSRGTWVRMKIGTYKGDLAKVLDVDTVRHRVTVKLIPRIDLQALASKLEGIDLAKKKAFVPPARLMNIEKARDLHIRVQRRKDNMTGEYYDNVNGMMFMDGFLIKIVSIKSISTQNVLPTFDELEKFGDIGSLSEVFRNSKKGHFKTGDDVIVQKGDLKNLRGCVEKVDDGIIHIRPYEKGLPQTLAINEQDLCKHFKSYEVTSDHGDPFSYLRTPQQIPQPPGRLPPRWPQSDFGGRQRGGRGRDSLIGTAVKIRLGPYKGYRARVKDIKGTTVRVELESQMKEVTVDRSHISTMPYRETSQHGMGNETPMHPCNTPARDPRATPIHDGMRTPMRDRAWNPYAPMSPTRVS